MNALVLRAGQERIAVAPKNGRSAEETSGAVARRAGDEPEERRHQRRDHDVEVDDQIGLDQSAIQLHRSFGLLAQSDQPRKVFRIMAAHRFGPSWAEKLVELSR